MKINLEDYKIVIGIGKAEGSSTLFLSRKNKEKLFCPYQPNDEQCGSWCVHFCIKDWGLQTKIRLCINLTCSTPPVNIWAEVLEDDKS